MNAHRRIGSLVGALLMLIAAHSSAQDTVATIKELYEAAAYEEVLAALDGVPVETVGSTEGRATELRKYRALSVFALGQVAAAEQVVEDLIVGDPLYRPDAQESPRWIAAVDRVRSKVVSALIQRRYVDGARHFDHREFALAIADFDVVLKLLDDPRLDSSVVQSLSGIRALSQGFVDLSRTATAVKVEALAVSAPSATSPVVLTGWIGQFTRFTVYTDTDPRIVPPVAVQQDLPQWPTQVRGSFEGELQVTISELGVVESAVLRKPLHPLYDGTLVEAAKRWRYQPAEKNGIPVKFRQVLRVTIGPADAANR